MKAKKWLVWLVAILAVMTGGVLAQAQTASAKTYTIPKSLRGKWYAYSMDTGKYDTINLTKTGEKRGKKTYKQRVKVKKVTLRHQKYYELLTTVNPFDVRVTKGTAFGKKRTMLWMASQGRITAYFRNKIHVSYQELLY